MENGSTEYDILAGIFEPATIDIDLAILLTKAREHSVALVGPAAEELFDPVPEQDLFEALNETLTLWNSPPDSGLAMSEM